MDAAPECFPIPLAIMQPGTVAPVNLYLRPSPSAELTLYKTAQTPLSNQTRQRLMERGVECLYVRKEDEDAYYAYVEDHMEAILRDKLLPPQEASRIVYQTSSHVMVDVFEDPRSGRNIHRAQRMVRATVGAILAEPDSLWLMTSVASHDYRTYAHCVDVCMFLVSAARDTLGIRDRRTLERVGVGGIFHDVGKSQIPKEILRKPGRLTPQEFDRIKEHPALGVQLISACRRLPRVAVQVIIATTP
ncbi:MAG: HD-GYP domain-containing protein [Planctomycetota bacterium]|jgi:HD-GYP domain-containing protein (c-di-GMP phosphodiesterase class II)